MKISYVASLLLILIISVSSCKSDDDNGVKLLPQDEQNRVDDRAIEKFLNDHYFNSVGKVTRFDMDATTDQSETPLMDLAQRDDAGFWIVERPGVEANGRGINDPENDSILIQYELMAFEGKITNDSVYYTSPRSVSTTINTTGYPIWDPSFYHKDISNIADAQKKWYEMEGIQDGLKYFNSKDKAIDALPAVDFQGIVIVPSRLAFGRDYNTLNLGPDNSIYLNFELYQVVDRN